MFAKKAWEEEVKVKKKKSKGSVKRAHEGG